MVTAPAPIVQPPSAVEGTRALTEALSKRSRQIQIDVLAESDHPDWDGFVRRHPHGSLFHQTKWFTAVEKTFGHTPRHLVARVRGRMVGVLPLVQVNSLLGGTMLLSVPYAVSGGVLADHSDVVDALWKRAIETGRRIDANVIEMRSETAQIGGIDCVEGYAAFRKELPAKVSDVLGWLPRKARAAARNAKTKHGLRVEFDQSRLRDVWRLYCRNMRRLGSINYPFRFFTQLVEAFGDDAFVQVVLKESRVIGGLVSFRFGETFLPYFVGCDERFNRCNTNHFVYLTAMERAVEVGCSVFDFGRTRIANEGPYNFKRFFGFEPAPLGYQRYVFANKTQANLSPSNAKFSLARKIWPHLPLTLTTLAGGLLSKHFPG